VVFAFHGGGGFHPCGVWRRSGGGDAVGEKHRGVEGTQHGSLILRSRLQYLGEGGSAHADPISSAELRRPRTRWVMTCGPA
jgi:hypothetical protein